MEIELQHTIDIPADPPWIPDKVDRFLRDHHVGLRRIVVHHEVAKGRWKTVNSFKLDGTTNKAPTVEPDVVATFAMLCIEAHFAKLGKGDQPAEPQMYRIMTNKLNAQGVEQRPSCEYLYNPEGDDADASVDGEAERNEERSMFMRVLERLEKQNDALFSENRGLVSEVKNVLNAQSSQFTPFATMIGFMTNMWVTGAQMQNQAMQYMFSERRADADARSADRKFDIIVEAVKTPLVAALEHKFGIKLNLDDDEDDDDDEAEDKPKAAKKPKPAERPAWDGTSKSSADDSASSPASAAGPAQSDAANDASPASSDDAPDPGATVRSPADGIDEDHPAAWFARTLGQTIRPAQWAKLAKLLSDDELAALSKLLESKTDRLLIKRYDAVWKGGKIPMDKLMALAGQLDDQQKKNLQALGELVESARAGYPGRS